MLAIVDIVNWEQSDVAAIGIPARQPQFSLPTSLIPALNVPELLRNPGQDIGCLDQRFLLPHARSLAPSKWHVFPRAWPYRVPATRVEIINVRTKDRRLSMEGVEAYRNSCAFRYVDW